MEKITNQALKWGVLSLFFWSSLTMQVFSSPSSTKQKSLAILKLNLSQDVKIDQGNLISERLRVLFQQKNVFQITDTATMQAVYLQKPLPPKKVCDTPCALSYGRYLKVQWVLTGNVSQPEGDFRIKIQLLNVGSGQVVKEELHHCDCPLGGVLERIAQNFSNELIKL